MKKYITICIFLFFIMMSFLVKAELSLSPKDKAALEVGHKIQAIQEAIKNPKKIGAINAVTDLGHLTDYYTLVHGWLSYQLSADQAILDNTSAELAPQIIKESSIFTTSY